MKYGVMVGAAALALVVASGAASAQDGDAEEGQKVFRQCQACHMVGDNAKARVGPPLNDLFGRQAGTYEGFRYSPAMKSAGEDGLVWNDETIEAYLRDPRGYIKGNRMAYAGLKKDDDVANVIAYLKTYDDQPDDDGAESTYTPQ